MRPVPGMLLQRQQAESEVGQYESALSAARGEYGRICERNREDLEAWRAGMQSDIVDMVKQFAWVQVCG